MKPTRFNVWVNAACVVFYLVAAAWLVSTDEWYWWFWVAGAVLFGVATYRAERSYRTRLSTWEMTEQTRQRMLRAMRGEY